MKYVIVALRERDPVVFSPIVGGIKETELYALGMLGEECEIDPLAVPGCPERMSFSWPNAQIHRACCLEGIWGLGLIRIDHPEPH